MNDAEAIDQLLATGLSDETRNIGEELFAVMRHHFESGREPDEATKLAAMALYTLARHTLESMLLLDLAGIADDDTGEPVLLENGKLPEALDDMLKGGSLMMALARDEDKDSPKEMALELVRSMFDKQTKMKYGKLALDNLRKGKYLDTHEK
jgi:hypothetical protein